MRMIVAGSRKWGDWGVMRKVLGEVVDQFEVNEVWSGGARGADEMGEVVCREMGLKVNVRKAEWGKWGISAGYRRTAEMLREVGCGVCVVFMVGESRGSEFTIQKAKGMGFKVVVVRA